MPSLYRLLLVIACLLPAGCTGSSTEKPANRPSGEPDSTAANSPVNVTLDLVNFEQITQRIAEHKGQVVVVDIWATYCPPCVQEFHNLVELSREYPADQLACISLSLDYQGIGKVDDQIEPVLTFLKKQRSAIENLMSSEDADVLVRKMGLPPIPVVYVYDRAGTLRKRFDNEMAKTKDEQFSYADVRKLVAELVKEPPAP